jgi:hypothetical protein
MSFHIDIEIIVSFFVTNVIIVINIVVFHDVHIMIIIIVLQVCYCQFLLTFYSTVIVCNKRPVRASSGITCSGIDRPAASSFFRD